MNVMRSRSAGQTIEGTPERRGNERRQAPRRGGSSPIVRDVSPTLAMAPEVTARHRRRWCTTPDTRERLRKAAAGTRPGERGALLRTEGRNASRSHRAPRGGRGRARTTEDGPRRRLRGASRRFVKGTPQPADWPHAVWTTRSSEQNGSGCPRNAPQVVRGDVPFDRVGGEWLFNLFTDRYERRAIVVTTHLPFAEWVPVFAGDEKLTTTVLDRRPIMRP